MSCQPDARKPRSVVAVPGGGFVTAPEGFHFDDHTPQLLRPDDLVVLVRGHRTTMGGYAKFKAAMTVAHRDRIASPEALVRASGPFLRDVDWRAAVEENIGPFEEADGCLVAETYMLRQGLRRQWQEPAWVVAGVSQDQTHVGAVFVMDHDADRTQALELLRQLLASITPNDPG